MPNRFCFVSDGDGHWYCIPVSQKKRFNFVIEAIENGDDNEGVWDEYAMFDSYRLGMYISNYSFTDMEEIPR